MATTQNTISINKHTQNLLECIRLVTKAYNMASEYIEYTNDNPRDADAEIDSRIGQPFEEFRFALAELVGQSIAESLIMDGIPA